MSPETLLEKHVDDAALNQCLAHAVAQGDIVNLRFIFMPSSPFRPDSPEEISMDKYAYLLPENDAASALREALSLVQRPDIADYVRAQLQRKGPPQLPWELVLALADNAVRLGKYTVAAQAYELLRIRRRMQELLLEQVTAHLQANRLDQAVTACLIHVGLDYDYAAFPEPLPASPTYQARALEMHLAAPGAPLPMPAMNEPPAFIRMALNYLLPQMDLLRALDGMPDETLTAFMALLVKRMDPDWPRFATAYREAADIMVGHESLVERINRYAPGTLGLLNETVLDQKQMTELKEMPALLLGADNPDWEWWQAIKHLAFIHPAAPLFVARQRLSAKEEVLAPRCRPDMPLAKELGLTA